MSTQLPIRVFARKCPLDAASGGVASSLPRRHFGSEDCLLDGAACQAPALGDTDLDLGNVQPTRVDVVKLDLTQDAGGGFLAEDLLEVAARIGVDVVERQVHLAHFRVSAAQHPADEADEILLRAPLGD